MVLPRSTLVSVVVLVLAACGGADRDRGGDGGRVGVDSGGCPSGLTLCGGDCVDLDTDNFNCGECGRACADSFCNAGTCDSSCGPGTVACGFRCCPDPPGCDPSGTSCAMPPVDGGMTSPTCPTDPPIDGAACETMGQRCTWVRCDTAGVVTATCGTDGWSVSVAECGEFECDLDTGTRCSADQICVARIGGAFLVDCQENPCGDAAIEESCACAACGGSECTGVTGRTVSCNTCPSGMLCP